MKRVTALFAAAFLTVAGLAVAQTTSGLYNLTDTWNNASTVFKGLQLNITNTASATASKIFDFQIGGVSVLNLDKSKQLALVNAGSATTPALVLGDGQQGIWSGSGTINFAGFGVSAGTFGPNSATLKGAVSFVATSTEGTGYQSFMRTDTDRADHLGVRNGTTAQRFSVYGTYGTAANWERLTFDATATGNRIRSVAGGTGTVRPLTFGVNTKAGTPDTTDLPAGDWGVWRDTVGGTTKIYHNFGGTIIAGPPFS